MTSGLEPHGTPPLYFTFAGLAALGLPHATTTRHFPGVTSPAEPIAPLGAEARAVLARAGLDLARVAWARQVHGAGAATAPSRGGFAGEADVLITREPGLPLAIFTADCLAIVLYDPEARALAVAHVGWRGTVLGAAQAAVAALARVGARPARLRAAISPSIGPCCYEVDGPVLDAFRGAYPGAWEQWVAPARAGHWMLDLWAANTALLAEAGVEPRRVESPRACTACRTDLFHSYRRGNRGRLVTVAALA